MRILQSARQKLRAYFTRDELADESGAMESSQTENQAASSEMVPEAEQKPTAHEERVVSDPEGAIGYGKTRAA